jgi:hypothetical protein
MASSHCGTAIFPGLQKQFLGTNPIPLRPPRLVVPQILDGPIQEEAPVLTSGTQNLTILHDGLWERNTSLLIARNH